MENNYRYFAGVDWQCSDERGSLFLIWGKVWLIIITDCLSFSTTLRVGNWIIIIIIKQADMKEKIRKEYLRRTRKLLETKLNSRNLIKGINTWAVRLVRYSGPFLKWTREELRQMDQRIRKLMTMHKALHPRDDVDRLYVSRKEGGRGLASIEDSVDASIQRLEDYKEKHEGGLITTIRNNTDNTIDNRMTKIRKQKWEEKQLHGRFKRLINNISHDKTWTWLRKGNFKRETESILMATQNISKRG